MQEMIDIETDPSRNNSAVSKVRILNFDNKRDTKEIATQVDGDYTELNSANK